VVGATITVLPAREAPDLAAATTRSDERGVWSVWAEPGEVVAIAAAPGYADGSGRGLCPGNDLALVLTPESVLIGRVIDAATREPIPGAQVAAQAESSGEDEAPVPGRAGATSSRDGQFRIDRLAPGRYVVAATAPLRRGQASESVRLGLGETSREILIAMHPAVPVAGRIVVGDAGLPCASGLAALYDPRNERRFEARTRVTGEVLIPGVLPGQYEVTASCSDVEETKVQPSLTIGRTPPAALVWRVAAGGQAIAGSVVTEEGAPASGVEVCASPSGGDTTDFACKRSGTDGSFRIPSLEPGTFEVLARSGRRALSPQAAQVHLLPGQDVVGLRLVLPTGARLEGAVVSQDGAPVAGAVVMVLGPWGDQSEARTRDDGGFVVTGLRPGAHRVSAGRDWQERDDADGVRVEVAAGATARVRVVLEAARGRITGRVLEGGRSVDDAFVTAARETRIQDNGEPPVTWGWSRRPVLTDGDGAFTLDALVDGHYTVRAYRRGGGDVAVAGVPTGRAVTLVLRPQGTLTGIVTTEGASPEDFSLLVEDREQGVRRAETYLHTGGAWVVRDLPPGHYLVSAAAPEGTGRVQVTLTEGQQRDGLRISLAARATLRGQVSELESGRPWPDAEVSVLHQPAGSASPREIVRADRDGRFEVTDVGVGRLWLRARARARSGVLAEGRVSVTVAAGGVQQVPALRMVRSRLEADERPGKLGFVTVATGSPDMLTGWVVSSVEADGPAASQLRVGDTIVAVAGQRVIGEYYELYGQLLAQVPAGKTVALTLSRGATVQVTAAPSSSL
jgi:hypothetical protein